jgi:hypothetical protein
MTSPSVSRAAIAALLLSACRPLEAASDSTLRYPAANDVALNTVCWTGSQFVAAGQGGVIFTSPDGTAWTSRHAPLATHWHASTAGGGTIVLTGDRAVVTSADGIVWMVQPLTDLFSGEAVAWNGSIFMLGWSHDFFTGSYTSPNGSTWTAMDRLSSGTFTGLASNGGQFVTIENYYESNVDKARLWTFSGTAWTTANMITTKLEELTWTGTRYIAVGPGGTAATSVDGIAWTPRTTGVTADLKRVIQGGSLAVAVGNGGTILTSPNGAAWTVQTSGTNRNLKSVAWSGTRYAAVGEGGLILTSTNGSDWQTAKTGTPQVVLPGFLGWTGTSGLAVGGGKTLYSADGNSWVKTAATGGPMASGSAQIVLPRFRLAAGAGRVVVTATDLSWNNFGYGGIWSAPLDGSEWTPLSIRAPNEGFTVFWTGTQFALLGRERHRSVDGFYDYTYFTATSPNGLAWTQFQSPLVASPTDLVWTGNRFMTTRGWWSSTNGSWTMPNSQDNLFLFWTGEKFIGVNADGKFSTSAGGLIWPAAQFGGLGGLDVLWTGSRLLAVNRLGVYEATLNGPWQLVSRRGGQSIAWTGTRALIATGTEIVSLEGVGLSAYGQWLGTQFTPAQLSDPAISGELADPDRDGQPNIVEYAMGTGPANTAQRPDITVEISEGKARFRWPQDTSRTDVSVTPQVSFDLGAWDDLSGTPVSGTAGGVRFMETVPQSIQRAAFFRLKVQSLD